MAETKFTPGPWRHDANIPTSFWADGVWLGSTNAESVSSFDERVANARLIAAAPEMFEALLFVKNWFAKLEDGCEDDDPLKAMRQRVHAPVHDAIDAAIAKAVQP